jgi:glycosyltransferase involved in cell wall biosynthesis
MDMNKLPLVGILVPTYNRGRTLDRTLQSILGQTFRDYEIIVIDDGSTDNTRALVKSLLQGVSYKYIYQANEGVAKARAAGMRASQGEYLAFCDSDDLWLPDKLENQMARFTPDIALVYSDAYACAELFPQPKARFRCFDLNKPFRGEVYGKLLKRNFIATSSVVARKSALRDFVAWPLTNCDDWQMWLWVARKGRFEYVAKPLIYYYEHSEGISKQKKRFTAARLSVRKEELRRLKKEGTVGVSFRMTVNLLILKDMLLLRALKIIPSGIVRRLLALYYKSLPLRKVLLKTGLGS